MNLADRQGGAGGGGDHPNGGLLLCDMGLEAHIVQIMQEKVNVYGQFNCLYFSSSGMGLQ